MFCSAFGTHGWYGKLVKDVGGAEHEGCPVGKSGGKEFVPAKSRSSNGVPAAVRYGDWSLDTYPFRPTPPSVYSMTSAVWLLMMSKKTFMPRAWAPSTSARRSSFVPRCGSMRVKSVIQ